jgi:hypothetical protein
VTDFQRQHTVRLETWMRAACMRSGPVGANRYRSKLHMTWVAHRAVLDRSMCGSEIGAVFDGASSGTACGGAGQ